MTPAGTSRNGVLALVLAVAMLPVVGACSGDDGEDEGRPSVPPSATAPVPTDPSESSGGAGEPGQPGNSTAQVSTTSSPEAAGTTTTTVPAGAVPGLGPLTLLTVGEGMGVRPVLRWGPVDGASAYVVVVNTADGGPYWTWQGAGTEVAFGGGPIDDPDTIGARLISPKTWFVVALDAAARPIAASAAGALVP